MACSTLNLTFREAEQWDAVCCNISCGSCLCADCRYFRQGGTSLL